MADTAERGRQVAELAAAAAHRKNLDEDELLGQRNTPLRRSAPRHRSSGMGSSSLRRHKSGDGLHAMSRSLGRSSGLVGPSKRGVNRSRSMVANPSPMLSRSVARSGGGLRRSDGNFDPDGAGGPAERGLRRTRSSFAAPARSHRAAPERRSVGRSDSSRAVPSRRGVGRTCSQESLDFMSQNRGSRTAPLRSSSHMSQLSMMRRHQSQDEQSLGDLSNFTMATMDSVNLRKQQDVADPIDDGATYRETDSVADHESVFTMATGATNDIMQQGGYKEFLPPEQDPNHIPYDGVSVADTVGSLGDDDFRSGVHNHRIVEDTRLVDDHPYDIACDAVSLSTINTTSVAYGGEGDNEESSYADDYESTLREEIVAFDEADDDDESSVHLEGLSENSEEEEESSDDE